MTPRRDRMREDVQVRILRLLRHNPDMSQRELAKAVGVSTGGIHYVLTALQDKGLIARGEAAAAGDRRRHVLVLTAKGIAETARLTRVFLARRIAEYEALGAEIDAVRQEIAADEVQEGQS